MFDVILSTTTHVTGSLGVENLTHDCNLRVFVNVTVDSVLSLTPRKCV